MAVRTYIVALERNSTGERFLERVNAATRAAAARAAFDVIAEAGWPAGEFSLVRVYRERRPFGRYVVPWIAFHGGAFWHGINVAAAVALGGYLVGFHDRAWYDAVTSHRVLFPLALLGLIGAIPLIRLARERLSGAAAVWAIFATFLLGWAAVLAGSDAFNYNHSNCWTIRQSGDAARGSLIQIIECAPGGGAPVQGSSFNPTTDSGSDRFCRQINTSSSGGTIWRCEAHNF